jgi:hypothetical protein
MRRAGRDPNVTVARRGVSWFVLLARVVSC